MGCDEKEDLYESLDWCQGKTILPGIRSRVYYTPKRSILKWPKLPDEIAEDGKFSDLAVYKGDFVLAAGVSWRHLDVITTDSPVNCESQGEVPSVTSLNKGTFKHPGAEEEATAFARKATSDDMVYLVQQRNGKFRVIGNEMYETITKVKLELGAAVTDKAGTTLEVEVTDICPAPFYRGKIEIEDGTISGADGSAVDEEENG